MSDAALYQDIRAIIDEARHRVYAGISAVQIEQNWKIGRRIVEEEQGGQERADYGKRTIADLATRPSSARASCRWLTRTMREMIFCIQNVYYVCDLFANAHLTFVYFVFAFAFYRRKMI